MKNPAYKLLIASCIILISAGCNKGGGYTPADHTTGLVNRVRTWSGTANGYIKGDTLYPGDTTHYAWPKAYSRIITDTTFAIQKINGFEINTILTDFSYLSTDTVNKIVKFDTVVASSGAPMSYVDYYSAKDSIYLELHQYSGFNTTANQYYQSNYYLHTNP